jgi:hypothetical protein
MPERRGGAGFLILGKMLPYFGDDVCIRLGYGSSISVIFSN